MYFRPLRENQAWQVPPSSVCILTLFYGGVYIKTRACVGVCLHAIFGSSSKTSGGGGRLCLLLLLHVLCHLLSSHASSSPASISCLQVTKVAPRRRRQRRIERKISSSRRWQHMHTYYTFCPSRSKCHLLLSVSLVFYVAVAISQSDCQLSETRSGLYTFPLSSRIIDAARIALAWNLLLLSSVYDPFFSACVPTRSNMGWLVGK